MKRIAGAPDYGPGAETQTEYTQKLRRENEEFFAKNGRSRAYHIVTFGCQMNAHDSEKIERLFSDMGYERAADELSADVLAYNTCCVRENAENRTYGKLGLLKNLKERGKEFKVILCGCMMQQDAVVEKIKESYRNTDVILGTFNLHRLPLALWTSMETNDLIIDVWEDDRETSSDLPSLREKKFKAGVNIMYGCDNFCSYCIVPYVRGRERSRDPAKILDEIRVLAADGVKELLLLGQNVNSYKAANGTDFPGLLRAASEIVGIERVRFMTSHPKDLSKRLIAEMRDNDKACKRLHLPLQSGSSAVLERMNRRYTKEGYLALARDIKSAVPEITLSTDIIVGFPGESDKDFEETLDVVRTVRFSGAYTFLYSKRAGTPAAADPGQIPENVMKERFSKLLSALNPIIYEENAKQIGSEAEILCENEGPGGIITGRTDNNTIVHFKGEGALIGEIVRVRITDCKTFYCTGVRI